MGFRALATDVDGTLTDRERGISLTAIQAIRDLEDRGVPVILASARPFPILNILREYIGCSGAIVCENGGFVEYQGKSCTIGDRMKGLEAYRLLKEKHGDDVKEAWTNRYNFVDVALARTIPSFEILSVVEGFPALKLLDSGFFYHIMPVDVEKGRGLMAAAEMMGIESNDVVAVGDSQVDVELLQAAGFGVAVSDASEDLKRVADSVTEKPDGEGVCEVIRRMF
jgi:phosphoglycolate phosphatase (TIGR01487 family)